MTFLSHSESARGPEADEIIAARITAVAVAAQGDQEFFPAWNSVVPGVPGVQFYVEASRAFRHYGFRK